VDEVGHHVLTVIITNASARGEYGTIARVAGRCEHRVCAASIVV
jgi:hypothetical protein